MGWGDFLDSVASARQEEVGANYHAHFPRKEFLCDAFHEMIFSTSISLLLFEVST